jgi:hypothetical protein
MGVKDVAGLLLRISPTVHNGNGNLFWNLGHFVCVDGLLFHHFRERLTGRHTALIQDNCRVHIGVVDPTTICRQESWAVSGIRILRNGDVVDLLATDPETGRPVVNEFYGDLSHIIRGFRLSLGFAGRMFDEARDQSAIDGSFSKSAHSSPWMRDAVSGFTVNCRLTDDDDSDNVRERCSEYGYREAPWHASLQGGEFALNAPRQMALSPVRATLGHSVLASTEDPERFVLVNTYTDPSRKGFTIEDTARLVRRVGASLGHGVKDGLLLASSGDPRIILHDSGTLTCLEHDRQGQRLLFKGGIDYGLSNMFLVCRRR